MALDWDDLRYLLALAAAGSMAGAARAVGVNASTMARRIAGLETALGVQLIARGAEGVYLSEAGAMAAETARAIENLVSALARRVGDSDTRPRGTVRVSVSDGFAPLLYGGLAELRRDHPDICVELVITSDRVDLLRHEADIAVRLFRETQPELVARKVGEFGWSVFASTAYIERMGLPSLDDLRQHDIIGYADASARSPGARWLESRADATRVVMRGTSLSAVRQAVSAGMGVAALPCWMAAGSPGLRRLTPSIIANTEAFLVLPPDLKDVSRVKIVVDALAAIFVREHALLAGA